ncbi:hypothetical protein D3C78_792380 [compost metagenome]
MGGVHLHAAEAGLFGQRRGAGEALDQRGDLRLVQGLGQREQLRQPAHVQRHGGGGHGGLAEVGLHLPAGVIDLHPELRPPGPADACPFAEAFQLLSFFQHHAPGAGHGAGVHHHVAGEQQAGATLGPGPVEAQQRVRRGLVLVGEVLLHRRLGDAVGNDGAIGQLQGLEGRHGLRLSGGMGAVRRRQDSVAAEPKLEVNFKVNRGDASPISRRVRCAHRLHGALTAGAQGAPYRPTTAHFGYRETRGSSAPAIRRVPSPACDRCRGAQRAARGEGAGTSPPHVRGG